MTQVFGNAVGQGSFELIPDKLIRINLRSVSGEPVNMETGVFRQEFLDHPSLVGSTIVPEQDHRFAQMPRQVFEKPGHLGRADVFLLVELGIKCNLSSFRGDRECRDSRDFSPASGDRKLGG